MDEECTPQTDFFDHEPSKVEKVEMRKTNKPPSEWLRLLCKDWADENDDLVDCADVRFLQYKPYLKGLLSPQLLCRLSTPPSKDPALDGTNSNAPVDFWRILGIEDEFDKAYIVAQIERFSSHYNIRGIPIEDVDGIFPSDVTSPDPAAMAAAGISVSPSGGIISYVDSNATAAAAAAVAAAASDVSKLSKRQYSEVTRAHRMAKDAERALENERKQIIKREQRRVSLEKKEHKAREREALTVRKSAEREARDASREERRRKKLEIRMQREKFAQEQKDAALKRAAELVASNRVPIEITRGAAAAKAAATAALAAGGVIQPIPDPSVEAMKKHRSAIVVSTAGDLHQIVMHSKNLWTKYNAIAKEHNQKVNWITVAKELGIHVKVREKYARMHARAEQRGFDWEKSSHWKIKDHPEVFLEPTQAEQKAKMPPPPPNSATTVLINGNKEVAEEAIAAAAAVVDASCVKVESVINGSEEETAGEAASTLVADPTSTPAGEVLVEEGIKHSSISI